MFLKVPFFSLTMIFFSDTFIFVSTEIPFLTISFRTLLILSAHTHVSAFIIHRNFYDIFLYPNNFFYYGINNPVHPLDYRLKIR